MKKTPLAKVHEKLGAKMVDFAGWHMPVYYTNVIEEHNTVRQKVGLFDICHMGEFIISGRGAFDFLQKVVTKDISGLESGKCCYSLLCYDNGGTIDDLFIYKIKDEEYMLVVNAANIEKDFTWLMKHKPEAVTLNDISDQTAKLDIHGPSAEKTLQKLTEYDLSKLKRFHFIDVKIEGIPAKISRTGYTAEDGFEIYFDAQKSLEIWNILLSAGEDYGIKPIGLGARDTLRIEACYPLYGHELDCDTTPIAAGLLFVIGFNKEFIGKKALFEQKQKGPGKSLTFFEMIEKGIPRQGYEIFKNNYKVGYVTSGTFSPTLKKPIGLGYITPELKEIGGTVDIKIRDALHKAKIVKRPFYEYTGRRSVNLINNPKELRYSKEHEWVRLEGGVAVVGITDYAQKQLTDIVFIELPKKGKQISENAILGVVESVKSVSDVLSPVNGEVIEVNEEIIGNPDLVNKEPYGKGWMAKIKLKDKSALSNLMSAEQYEKFVGEEEH